MMPKTIVIYLGVVLLLFAVFVDPFTSVFAPKCMFKYLIGYDCPACGIQRAFHSIFNGDVATALRYNYFLLISVPYFIMVAITTFCKMNYIVKMRYYVQHPMVVKFVLVLTCVWWVVRNIPIIKALMNML